MDTTVTFRTMVKSPSTITVPKEYRSDLTGFEGGVVRAVLSPTNSPEDPESTVFNMRVGHYASQLYPAGNTGSELFEHLLKYHGKNMYVTIATTMDGASNDVVA